MPKPKKAFTLIELLVVIAIIGVLATISIIALQNARAKSRDAKRAGDMKQIQTALELFFNDKNRYPTAEEFALGSIFSTSTYGTSTYMQIIPSAPTPSDGSCTSGQNSVYYQQTENGNSYTISFCLGNTTGTLTAGPKCLTPAGIMDVDCSSGGGGEIIYAKFANTISLPGCQAGTSIKNTPDNKYILNNGDPTNFLRILSDGSPDGTFGTNGFLGVSSYGFSGIVPDFFELDGDKYIIGGTDSSNNALMARLLSDGSLDTTFSSDGLVELGSNNTPVFVKKISDGKYIVIGWLPGGSQSFITRLLPDGSLDTSFGSSGTTILSYGSQVLVRAVEETSDGKYIMTADAVPSLLIRVLSDGNLDTSFGTNGYKELSSFSGVYSIHRTSDNKYILAGVYNNGSDMDALLARVLSDGSFDTSFDSDGMFIYGGADYQESRYLTETSDGKLVATVDVPDNDGDAVVIKLLANGSYDTSFGNGGQIQLGNSAFQWPASIIEAGDHGYIFTGEDDSLDSCDIWIVKMDSNGNYQ